MKKQILNSFLVAFVALSFTACKNENTKEELSAEITDKVESIKATSTGGSYLVQSTDSSIAWEGSKPTGTHTGTINVSDGAVFMENGVLTGGKFIIDMKSITVTDLEAGKGKESLENHLKGTIEGKEGDFFNVTKFPESKFVITSVKNNKDGSSKLMGSLTIKDKTNPVTMVVRVEENGNKVSFKSEEFKIDRTKWGVNFGSKSIFDSLGDKFIDDIMKLQITVVASK